MPLAATPSCDLQGGSWVVATHLRRASAAASKERRLRIGSTTEWRAIMGGLLPGRKVLQG